MSYISCGIKPPYGRYNIYHSICLIPRTGVHSVNMIKALLHLFKEWHSEKNCFKLLPRWNSWKEVSKILPEVSPVGMFFPRRPQYQNPEQLVSAKRLHNCTILNILFFTWKFYCQNNVSLLHIIPQWHFSFLISSTEKVCLRVNSFEVFLKVCNLNIFLLFVTF